jgi:glycosyltransferase involved in cell wall biosynthesis
VTYRTVYLARTGINPFADIHSLLNLILLFRSIKPDVFLGYTIKPVIYGSLAARLAGVSQIFSMITGVGYALSNYDRKSRIVGRVVKAMYRFVLKRNRRVFFQNPDDRQLFLDQLLIENERQTCLINGSGVDIDTFSPEPMPENISFLLIARLLRDKGIVEYAQAARAIRKKYPEITCRLVGVFEDSPSSLSESDVMNWAKQGTIELLGEMDDVRPALADCSIYVLPSYREGTPRTVLEAMSMGRPIITTNVPGCRETVENGVNGYLVPVRDVQSLVAKMESFIKCPETIASMGAASRKIAVEKYDVRKVTASILAAMQLD